MDHRFLPEMDCFLHRRRRKVEAALPFHELPWDSWRRRKRKTVYNKSVPLISRHADLFTSGRAPLLITRCAELKGSIRESCSLTGELIELRRYDHLNSHVDLFR